jgi:hypothetical protein
MAEADRSEGVVNRLVLILSGSYTQPVIILPVWIDDWVYQCCGEQRRVGQAVKLELTFEGEVEAAAEPDRIDVVGDGEVVIVGTAAGPPDDVGGGDGMEGTLIVSGALRFAIEGTAPAPQVICSGRLLELRHGYPAGRTRGELVGLHRRPGIVRAIDHGTSVIEGYSVGDELASTEDWSKGLVGGDWPTWALELMVKVG